MRPTTTDLLTALAVPTLAALGGAAVVFSEFDDAPGGILIGFFLVIAATVLSLRSQKPKRSEPQQ